GCHALTRVRPRSCPARAPGPLGSCPAGPWPARVLYGSALCGSERRGWRLWSFWRFRWPRMLRLRPGPGSALASHRERPLRHTLVPRERRGRHTPVPRERRGRHTLVPRERCGRQGLVLREPLDDPPRVGLARWCSTPERAPGGPVPKQHGCRAVPEDHRPAGVVVPVRHLVVVAGEVARGLAMGEGRVEEAVAKVGSRGHDVRVDVVDAVTTGDPGSCRYPAGVWCRWWAWSVVLAVVV